MDGEKIYPALIGVMSDIGAIGKGKKNQQQGFMYRGIDDVMNALQPALVKNKVLIIPEVLEENREERQTTKGGNMFSVRLKMVFHFTAEDGSNVPVCVIGEAMDSGDKATNKAMSIAYKYACFQIFCIPTEEMKNADPDGYIPEQSTKKEEDPVIDALKLKALLNSMEKKGVTVEQVTSRAGVAKLEDLHMSQFMSICRILEKTPDKPPVDLGFDK